MPFKKGQTPWNKGLKGINAGENNPFYGKTHSDEQKAKWSEMRSGVDPWNKGKELSEEHRKNLSKSHEGLRNSPDTEFKATGNTFKGSKTEYRNLHKWVEKELGRPCSCEMCKKDFEERKMNWANISGDYLKEVTDWKRLCNKCHHEFDGGRVRVNGNVA